MLLLSILPTERLPTKRPVQPAVGLPDRGGLVVLFRCTAILSVTLLTFCPCIAFA